MMVLSSQIHRQKDMISWTWLSNCLKALLAGPFLIFQPIRHFVCSSFILTASNARLSTDGWRPSKHPNLPNVNVKREWTVVSSVLPPFLFSAPSTREDLPCSKVKNDPLIRLLHHYGAYPTIGKWQYGVRGRQRALFIAKPSCKRAQQLPLWSFITLEVISPLLLHSPARSELRGTFCSACWKWLTD